VLHFCDINLKTKRMNWDLFFKDNHDFQVWNREHFIWLAVAAASWIFWIRLGRQQKTAQAQTRIALIMSILPIMIWFYFLAVIISNGGSNLGNTLPFHLCYTLNFLMPIMLGRRLFWLFEIMYFWVMAACLQALITPDLSTAFPAFTSVKYWPIHIGLIGSVQYAIFVYGWKPRYQGIFWALLGGNLFYCLLHPLNLWLDTNFMYTISPPKGSLLELLGEHYILWAELLALLFFHVVFVPIWWSERRRKMQDL
jgi:hypothetical integral membrane protein (TIGR02206 family)